MLVFSRNCHKSDIIIGGQSEVTVKILEINRGQVRIGIEAPKCIPVHRREVFERIQLETETKTDTDTEAEVEKKK